MADNNNQFKKDVNAILDYTWDWRAKTNGTGSSDWLAVGENIATATLTADPALTLANTSNTTSQVTTFVQPGGAPGTTYKVTCKIVTNSTPARTDERSIYITIQNL